MAPSDISTSRSRGRPVEIDRDHLAQVALHLFAERGYDQVSAAEIATAAGISRRSLFRYFPTKADLVWDRFDESLALLEEALASETGDPIEAAGRALGTMVEHTRSLAVSRVRLRIISANSDLFSFGTGRLQNQATILRTYLMSRGFGELQARVVAAALTMAVFQGYVHWADSETEVHPAEIVREAIEALALL